MISQDDLLGFVGAITGMMIGNIIYDSLYWAILPDTPYYLRKKIRYLENRLIAVSLQVNEEIIRP